MGYIATLVTIAVAILGVLYSKSGERATLKPIGYVFILLALIGGAIALIDVYNKSVSSDLAKSETERLRALNAKLVDEVSRLRVESFKLGEPPVRVMFLLDYSDLEREGLKGAAGPFPSDGTQGEIGELYVRTSEQLGAAGTIKANPDHGVSVRQKPFYDDLPVGADPWFTEVVGIKAIGVNLYTGEKNKSLRSIVSFLRNYPHYGRISIKYKDAELNKSEITDILSNVRAYYKIYAKLKDGEQDCPSVIYANAEFRTSFPEKDLLLIDMWVSNHGLEVDDCEKVDF